MSAKLSALLALEIFGRSFKRTTKEEEEEEAEKEIYGDAFLPRPSYHVGMNARLEKILQQKNSDEDDSSSTECRPGSYKEFLRRLHSFSKTSAGWFAKPDPISPVVCARNGWINSGYNTLQCSSCQETLVHNLVGTCT
jgi:hypothetical protein